MVVSPVERIDLPLSRYFCTRRVQIWIFCSGSNQLCLWFLGLSNGNDEGNDYDLKPIPCDAQEIKHQELVLFEFSSYILFLFSCIFLTYVSLVFVELSIYYLCPILIIPYEKTYNFRIKNNNILPFIVSWIFPHQNQLRSWIFSPSNFLLVRTDDGYPFPACKNI